VSSGSISIVALLLLLMGAPARISPSTERKRPAWSIGDKAMKRMVLRAALCLALLGPAACGSSTGDRAASGAGIGAGVGALGGFLVGAPLEGALIGGAIGAGTGALTDQNQINLGRPIWR
jgi:hypothetical protein